MSSAMPESDRIQVDHLASSIERLCEDADNDRIVTSALLTALFRESVKRDVLPVVLMKEVLSGFDQAGLDAMAVASMAILMREADSEAPPRKP